MRSLRDGVSGHGQLAGPRRLPSRWSSWLLIDRLDSKVSRGKKVDRTSYGLSDSPKNHDLRGRRQIDFGCSIPPERLFVFVAASLAGKARQMFNISSESSIA